ncbi:MAG TPA: cupredoxin domain-containing protein [Dehalococcoidia bacterium]|nr:cupredoxin domain-containing protein [Dehalococcoidia bacterium]
MRRLFSPVAAVLVVVGAMLAVACGGGSSSNLTALATQSADATPSASLEISAKSLKFDKKALVAPAGKDLTIHFDNKDNSVQHNVAVYTDKSAKTKLFAGEIIKGADTTDYTFSAPASGVFFFRCDVHPDMNGVFIVK